MKRYYKLKTGIKFSLLILSLLLFTASLAQAAIGTGGATCTAQSKTAGTTLACTVATQNLEAGNIAVMWFASDNIASIDGDDPLLSVTDSGGNCWTVQRCFANDAGATTCIATSKITTALTSGSGTITANFPQSITAKAMIVREFTVGAGNTIAIAGTPQILANDAADPGSMTIASLASAEHLFVRSTALERPNANWTATGGYTTFNCNGTTGGGAASNMNICGEFRILTDTTSTSDPAATAVDSASIFIAFDEVATGAPVYKAAGRAVSDTVGVTPAWPAHAVDDIALLFVESAGGEAVTLSTPAGFVQVTNSPKATGAGTAGTQLSVFWARATSTTMAAPTITDPGNHVYAQILTYCGVATSGDPWDVTGGDVKAVASNSVSVTGVLTTVNNTLIVQAVTRENDNAPGAAFSAQTNANLTNIAERSDAGTNSGNGGGFVIWDGIKAALGGTGTTSANINASVVNAFLTIALRPPPVVGAPSKLAFLQQPGNTIFNQTISPAVTVEIQDSLGNRVLTATNSVTIAIGTNPAGGTLTGGGAVNAVAGVATFSNLSINNAGNGYTLTASSTGLTGATSNAFNITTGAYGLTECAGSRYGEDLLCTAGDVSITGIAARTGSPTSCVGGESIILNLDVTVNVGGPARWDVGIFLANDGLNPKDTPASGGSNSCSVAILPFTPDPFRNLDGDGCGDIDKPPDSGLLLMDNVLLKCASAAGLGGNLSVPFVVSWDNQSSPAGGTCNSIANPVPNTKAKCNKPSGILGSVYVVVLPTITNTDNKTTLSPDEITNYFVVISNTTGAALTNAVFKNPPVLGLAFNSVTCAAAGGATCSCVSCSVGDMQVAGITIPSLPDNTAQSITGITKANPAVVTYSGLDTYANGDRVIISGVVGMTEVNDREFTVANVNTGANTFELSGINSADYTAWTSGGTVKEISSVTFTINATVSPNPPATITDIASVTVVEPAAASETARTVSASDSTGGSGSGSGGGRVKVIKWREVFQ